MGSAAHLESLPDGENGLAARLPPDDVGRRVPVGLAGDLHRVGVRFELVLVGALDELQRGRVHDVQHSRLLTALARVGVVHRQTLQLLAVAILRW